MAKGSTVDTLFLYALYAFMAYGLYMFWSGYGKTSYSACKRVGGAATNAIYEVGNDAYNQYKMRSWRIRDPSGMQQ